MHASFKSRLRLTARGLCKSCWLNVRGARNPPGPYFGSHREGVHCSLRAALELALTCINQHSRLAAALYVCVGVGVGVGGGGCD